MKRDRTQKGSIITVALLFVSSLQAAEMIVDFTHQTGTDNIRDADGNSSDGDTWNFSDLTPLFDGAETGDDSNTKIYGGLKATWNNNASYNPNLLLRSSDGILQMQVNAGTSSQGLEGMLVWNKADFLNHTGKLVVFDATSSMSLERGNSGSNTTVRFVVNNGGTYYVSNTSSDGTMVLDNPGADTWALIDTSDYSVIGPYEFQEFSDIRGVGIYLSQSGINQTIFKLNDFQVRANALDYSSDDIEFANIFASGCVLQRNQTVPIWGTATPGDTITVAINGQSKQGHADVQGNWRIELDPESAGGPYMLTASGSVSAPVELTEVYFGDVWIMTGQSNMFQTLGGQVSRFSDDYPAVPDNSDNFDDIRFAIVETVTANTAADDVTMDRSWNRWQRSQLNPISTVGYFFARYLNEQLDANGMDDVPLGFIKVCVGGTSIEEWVAEDKLNAAKAANSGLIAQRMNSNVHSKPKAKLLSRL